MSLAPGIRIGPYEVLSTIGAGGMGEVYRARDHRLRRDVALKLIPSPASGETGTLERFRREAHAASALNHPNIVTIYETGEAPEGPYIAMELVDGDTLRQLTGTASLEIIPRLGVQIARALAVAHEAGIVHRDIKPENIMVRPDGYVKVLDFGVARFSNERVLFTDRTTALTETRTVLGTVRYMSPEQARGEPIGRAADIFALGLVLYELATGQHPFDADSPLVVLHGIASQTPVAPARLRPGISVRLNDLILRMLAHEEGRRPTAIEVATELADLERTPTQLSSPVISKGRKAGVGRARERAELHSALDFVRSGCGLLLSVAGEAGIGKTTLIEDFLSELESADRRYRIARGRCSERLAGTEAYLPFLEALDELIHGASSDSVVRQVEVLAPTWYEQLKPIAGGRLSDSRPLPEVKAASAERFKFELATLLHEVSRQDPTVLFFDDVHWSDVATVDLLSYLATRFDSMRLLIIVAYRPSDLLSSHHPFASLKLELQGRGMSREIALPFLERQDVDAYLAREYPGHRFPPELPAFVHRRTEGSPLFMVDLLRELRERGVLAEQDGHWAATQSIASIEEKMPASVRSLIQRMIDRLDERHRQLLTTASVQGSDFDAAVIARALNHDAAEVEDGFDMIERTHGLIRSTGEKELPDGTLTLGYRFVHVLYQNALHSSLKPARRTGLSGAVAHALLGFYGAKASTVATELAVLFEAARELSSAADYLLMATQNAVRVFASEEAIGLARRGLAVLAKLPPSADRDQRELRAQILLGAALAARKGYSDPEVELANARTRELCLELGDIPEKFSALYGVYTFFSVRANFQASLEILDQLLRIAVAERNPTRLLIAHMGYVGPLLHSGDIHGALTRLEESLRVYDPAAYHPQLEIHGVDPRTTVSIWFSLALWFAGRLDQSVQRADESLVLARQTGHPLTLTYVLTLLAWLYTYRREPEIVERYAGEAVALCREHGFNQWLAAATIYWGWARVERGHPDVLPTMNYALAAYRAAGGVMILPNLLAITAEASVRTGDHDGAMRLVTDALDIVQSTGERCWEADLHRLRGELLFRQSGGEFAAEQSVQRAVEVARALGVRVLELRAAASLERMHRDRGRQSEGRAALADAYNWFTEGLETPDLQNARQLLDAGVDPTTAMRTE